jgi:hypothetical protein
LPAISRANAALPSATTPSAPALADSLPPLGAAADSPTALALGALEPAERNTIEQHLIWCGRCRRAVAEARKATDLLPLLAPVATPSPSVKLALMDRIQRENGRTQPQQMANPWAQPAPAPLTSDRGLSSGAPWQRWLPSIIVAPLAIVLVVLAAWTNSLRNEVEYLQAEQQEATVTTTGTGMQLYAMNPTCPTCTKNASGHFGGDPEGSIGVVVAWNLDPNEQHQVWCVDRNGEKWMVTDLDVEPTGDVVQTISFPQPLGGYQQIYVARHDGTADPDAELMVSMDKQPTEETPTAEPAVPAGT